MSRRLRSGSSSHQDVSKSFVYGNLPEDMDGVETEVTVGEHSEGSDVDEKQSFSDDVGLAVTVGGVEHFGREGSSHLAIAGRYATKAMPTLQIIHRLLTISPDDPEVMRKVPQGHMANTSFVIGIPSVTHWKSLLSDSLGSWKASKGPTNIFVRKDHDDSGEIVATAIDQMEYAQQPDTYNYFFFQRRAYVNASCPQYHRSIVTSADQRCQYAYMQYYFRDAVEHEFQITVHAKDHKSSRGYTSTSSGRKRKDPSSTVAMTTPQRSTSYMTTGVVGSGTSNLNHLSKNAVMKVDIIGVVPSETAMFKSTVLPDQLEDVISKCMQEIKTSDAFIQEVKMAPTIEISLANRRQLNDLRRFCTNSLNYSILGKDSIPNLGETGYTASFTVYEHMLLRGKDGKHPLVLGPIFLHQFAMDWATAFHFAGMMVTIEPKLLNLVAFSPSTEPDVDEAFLQVFRSAKRHVPENLLLNIVVTKLEELGIADDSAEVIKQGVVEVIQATDPLSELDQRVYQHLDTWQSLHQNGTDFGQFFLNNVVPTIRQNLELREKCDGVSVESYTRQQCVRIKELIKKTCAKKCTLPELIRKLREIVYKQEKDLEGAVMGRSEYKLDGEYAQLALDEGDFFSSTKTPLGQRRILLNRIHEEELH